MRIADTEIGGKNPPYIIAEISCNHGGGFENACRLIKAAKRNGANAAKLQAYTPDTITIDCNKVDFIVQEGIWKGISLYNLYSKTYTPFEWFPRLFNLANREGITLFASVFDKSSIDMLERLGCPAYKIASFEIVDLPLIKYAASTKKPLIISTGLASNQEILEANEASGFNAAFLHCTSDYPATTENANLGRMSEIDHLLGFRNIIGLSDHTLSHDAAVAAVARGASIIEKHLKLSDVETEDKSFSMNPLNFGIMVKAVNEIWHALQPSNPAPNPSYQFRRSLYAVQDIAEGERFSIENIRSIRPAYGAPPKLITKLIGKKSSRSFRRGDPIVA